MKPEGKKVTRFFPDLLFKDYLGKAWEIVIFKFYLVYKLTEWFPCTDNIGHEWLNRLVFVI